MGQPRCEEKPSIIKHVYMCVKCPEADWHSQTHKLTRTHGVLLRERVFVFEGVVGELRAVVCRSVTVITGSIERNSAVTCDTQTESSEYTQSQNRLCRRCFTLPER